LSTIIYNNKKWSRCTKKKGKKSKERRIEREIKKKSEGHNRVFHPKSFDTILKFKSARIKLMKPL